jgi:D-beta-D-heptose 7-phosphate kinase/D-beta-D-heptose 1-phosphate adenosyltransferase|tara:strand:- start:194 stop:586 length:393 start_codon:yes stop_codon:yes gene_type:complete
MVKVWTNGCFDVLHRGHFEMLKHAKSLGDYLIVGIDSDQKVKKDKGNDRPYNSTEDRKFALESIKYVDTVVVFDSRTGLEQVIKSISPDIMVIGSDWKDKEVVGKEYTQKLCFFDRIERYSTTKILKGIK